MNKNFFAKIQDLLLKKEKRVEEEIKAVEEDDPVMSDALAEATEPGTDSWKTDAHTQLAAMKQNLTDLLGRIKKALVSLQTGKYGKCETCGRAIEPARLKLMPETLICMSCSKKKSK
ncbi:hypothetical protein A2631_01010 [Candidatus Daviesbacteria bacterium RIFCSPHIGHO2_01_FULL_44_29]|uniref:Zinc finger DksA/TraR C4-type domain-containing protein n=1 Tax=Candidatus Daviesbacteria bacterium RIFCSPHIGHO2_02_FULL_43_12 TaxID=1797776 RepID=A0A1F5KHX4_9BACT|nr:MAG: hypothetical protein A2631_01010 [Candidatus Daviesbacteria bacterium RIFCSPHIGHO2_01_FULL_44_29]OGE40434.1 MAG: hypothetical protein A3D25_05410 [Candidatus Daviesbacteria bacterium RIFCSPHIGHO2_02_FULL_43_12]OGE40623.1 MAG: hypothetical protein A3E86_04125 [Candidatus Daviesbacteria bacterium RIFCSPHIGHO2_12_FULL_47_45]OGE69706.1 MAG: hypothetical protein A3B55_05925 [Candidatus Daviesbacteria bacterium RIFCSPLOWO2_01_FULL_43_15]